MERKMGQSPLRQKMLDKSYIPKIMKLQDEIMRHLEVQELFAPSTQEEYEATLGGQGCIVGYVTEEDELVAMGSYIMFGRHDHNYGYDIGINDERLLEIGQIEATVVAPSYRGRGLQYKMCQALEEEAKNNKNILLCATASPLNKYSVHTFMKLGYTIHSEKIKYGGLRRYLLVKQLKDKL